jgi:hypothetical protein
MSENAKVKIDKFSGASNNGIYYNEGFSPSVESGKKILNESFQSVEKFNNVTTGFSDIGDVKSVAFLNTLYGSEAYRLVLDSFSHLYAFSDFQNEVKNGKVGGISADGNYNYNQYPDILELQSGNLIYTSAYHASFIIRGTCTIGSSTTKIIDKAGRNFTSLGIVVGDSKKNKVVNLKTGVTYTITAISTTNSTNDTITFTANGSNDNASNSEFLAFVYDKWDLTSGLSLPSFKSQPDAIYWHRQLKEYYGEVYLLNGNYIGRLDTTETTITKDFKQFLKGHQATSFDVNVGNILFSTYSSNGAFLCLWDGFSDGFNNIIRIDAPAFDVKAFGTGWIYLSNGAVYFTNGFSIQKVTEYLDALELSQVSIANYSFNQIAVLNNTIFFASNNSNGNRTLPGIYAFNAEKNWTFIPVKYKSRNYGSPTSIFINNGYSSTWGTFNPTLEVGGKSFYNAIYDNSAENDNCSHSFIYFLDLPVKTQINKVELTLARSFKKPMTNFNPNSTSEITVSISDGTNGIFSQAQASSIPSVSTINVDGTSQSASVGDEIIFKDGACQGERTFITAIANKGASNEQWTVAPVLSTTDNSSSNIKVVRVKLCETRTIDLRTQKEAVVFNADGSFYKQVYIEVVVHGGSSNYPVSILDINVF